MGVTSGRITRALNTKLKSIGIGIVVGLCARSVESIAGWGRQFGFVTDEVEVDGIKSWLSDDEDGLYARPMAELMYDSVHQFWDEQGVGAFKDLCHTCRGTITAAHMFELERSQFRQWGDLEWDPTIQF